ncbi:purine nucleoside permease [Sphingomonas oleivorans]|uniref:Purine nucleoside permease n=2 Tax=Sphingomonas oleivorans TaxID=1735121 RepID=A0A2T5FV83_9SPHN|nr:purine nucleoside permease [Sphingomonas oleivorans]
MRRKIFAAALLIFGSALPAAAGAATKTLEPIEVRVVVVTAFEIGEDTGDKAGEFQAWAEEMPQILPFPTGFRDLRYDPARKVLALSTGIGTSRAAMSTLALGLDPRFDLSHAYWVVAAIAGVNPNEASIGSAAWIGDVIDTDFIYYIDSREIPSGWKTGIVPRDRNEPFQQPLPDTSYNLFPLNHSLRDWAFELTKDSKLPDNSALQEIRTRYADYPKAVEPPKVITGDQASGQGFTHGKIINEHMERWVSYWTGGNGRFVMKAEEDTGVIGAIQRLEKIGRADTSRVLVLRTGSNYHMQPPSMDAATSLFGENIGSPGLKASLLAAHVVGGRVVNELAGNWSRYRDRVPSLERAK